MSAPGPFGRLRLRVASALGDANARAARDVLGRLDASARALEFTFAGDTGLRGDADTLRTYGGAPAAQAEEDAEALTRLEADARSALADGYRHLNEGRPMEAALAADLVERHRAGAGERFQRLRDLVQAHCQAQRQAWERLANDETVARAGFLDAELAKLPQIPQLPRPSVAEFAEPYQRALDAVPPAYQRGASDAVSFDASAVARDVDAAIKAAPAAEQRLTQHVYDATRGHEAALGRDRARRLLESLRDPAAIRDLRRERPELFDQQPALFSGNLLPMLLMMSLFSHHGADWTTPTAANAAGAEAWLGDLGVPTGDELDAVLHQADEPMMVDDLSEMHDDLAGDGGDGGDA